MKIGDVEVGKSYEYKFYGGRYKGSRADVLEIGVTLKRYDFPGIKVMIHEAGRTIEKDVPARCLYRLWSEAEAEYAAHDAEARKRYKAVHELSMIRIDLELALREAIPGASLKFYDSGYGCLAIYLKDPADVLTMIDILTDTYKAGT